jgi:hypothetical protein
VTHAERVTRAGFLALAMTVTVALAGLVAPAGAGGAVLASPTGATASAGGCPPHVRAVCVDRTDGGHTVRLRVGQSVMVALSGSTLRWSGLGQAGPMVLRRGGPVRHPAGGLTATYVAVHDGRTVLRASGAPICAPGKPCPQFILLWQVRVVVG